VREERIEALKESLIHFADYADSELRAATDTIAAATDDQGVQRALLLWKINALPDMPGDLARKPPRDLLLDWWALWLRVSLYLGEGQGRTLFGDQQRTALAAATAILQRIEAMGIEYVPPELLTEANKHVTRYAQEHPIKGVFAVEAPADFAHTKGGQGLLGGVLAAPFHAIGEGLDPTSSLAASVDQFAELMQDYPSLVRWQAMLLLLELERSAVIGSSVQSAEVISKAVTRIAAVSEDLPEDVRKELQLLLTDLESQYPQLQAMLREARQTVDGINQALERAETVSATLEGALKNFSQAGEIWTTTADAVTRTIAQIQEFGTGSRDSEKQPSGAPAEQSKFDISEYTDTAEALAAAVKELRLLLTDVRDFADSDAISRATAQASAGVIDHAFYRALIFALLVLLALIVYRVVGKRLVGRWAP